jgi:hypothetical protein
MAIVPYRRLSAAMHHMETPQQRKHVGYLIDRNFDELCDECGGSSCLWGFNAEGGTSSLTTGNSAVINVLGSSSGDLYPTESGSDSLPAGVWHVNGHVRVSFSSAPTPGTGVFVSVLGPTLDGGRIQGFDYIHSAIQAASIPFAGVLLSESTWTPSITLGNQSGVTISTATVFYEAFGGTPCEHSIASGGG